MMESVKAWYQAGKIMEASRDVPGTDATLSVSQDAIGIPQTVSFKAGVLVSKVKRVRMKLGRRRSAS